MSTVISVENVSKSYRLGQIGGGTLKEDVSRWWAKLRGQPDPFLKIGEERKTEVRRRKSDVSGQTSDLRSPSSNIFWALQDVSFEVKQGEVLGIIGRNGAGKSTLLKILSQVTTPTSGEIKVRGRIASLLEVGTGFHPDLTGRENVFLNGAILGMTKAEIRKKFDEIVDFSGVEQFIDTPVKRYSSGMYVRLAFAVAAHLEPEILIVDEVLAVGDAEFQKKCLGKMQDVSRGGRTVLFVSHNMPAVTNICRRAILMHKGVVSHDSSTDRVIAHYLGEQFTANALLEWKTGDLPLSSAIQFRKCFIQDDNCQIAGRLDLRRGFSIGLEYEVFEPIKDLVIGFDMHNSQGVLVCGSNNTELGYGKTQSLGVYTTTCRFPGYLLNEDRYQLRFIAHGAKTILLSTELCLGFDMQDVIGHGPDFQKVHGILRPKLEWHIDHS